MMDIDRISCIFGSFTRRRQSQELSAKRRFFHDRSKSAPHQTKKNVTTAQRTKSFIGSSYEVDKFKCPICTNQFVEPRVLPCLHTFCLKCLVGLQKKGYQGSFLYQDTRTGSLDSKRPNKRNTNNNHLLDKICCPTCGTYSEIPNTGVAAFPPNYALQHQMVLATINSRSTHLLCDLCALDVSATARCMDCAISFCQECEDIHLRQKFSADHEVLSLEKARKKGITKVRRRIMCLKHPDLELLIFCNTCSQVICTDCLNVSHSDHQCIPVTRAANTHISQLRTAAARARCLIEETAAEATILNAASRQIEERCNLVQEEVERFMEEYVKAVNEHKQGLLERIRQFRTEKLQHIAQEKIKLQRRIRDARDLGLFLSDLLSDGSEVEVLSFLNPVMKKIQECDHMKETEDTRVTGILQFIPEASVRMENRNYCLFGNVTTQAVSPEHCVLKIEGLQNLLVGKKTEVLLETRDDENMPLDRGGEMISAEIVQKEDVIPRTLAVQDNNNGTYIISFTPYNVGKFSLDVIIKGRSISHCPQEIVVRPGKNHRGTFHCCSFCSSEGNKEAPPCGCGGRMPGGYRGCGHGHEGHPGRRHWSCCGNVREHSECTATIYQFTL